MHERGKSYDPIVPAKRPNKVAQAAAEAVEGRGSAKENAASKTHSGRRAGTSVSSALDRVRQVAKGDKEVRFTALLHHKPWNAWRQPTERSSPRRRRE